MKEPIIVGNWKMNKTVKEAKELAIQMKLGLDKIKGISKIICPPFIAIEPMGHLLSGSSIDLGAQNMHFENNGSYTGEISPQMLVQICKFVIVGHSERRQIFRETDDSIGRKVKAALDVGLKPILCVGETSDEREQGNAESVIARQIRQGLSQVNSAENIILAYEPVWAIGTGEAATPDDAQSMSSHIRKTIADMYDYSGTYKTPLLYGGSVNAKNVADFVRQTDINGALVGGASLDSKSFVDLTRIAAEVLA